MRSDRSRSDPSGLGGSKASGASLLFGMGFHRVQALYSQGGVDIDPGMVPRTTSFLDEKNMHFSTLDMESKYASAPPALGGKSKSQKKDTPKKQGLGDYQQLPTNAHADAIQHRISEAELPEADLLTKNQVIVYLVTAIIGCGVVVLPSLMAIGGWIVTPVIAAVVTLAFMEIGRVMDRAITCADFRTKTKAKSFEDLGSAALNDVGIVLIRVVTGTGFCGTLIVYSMLIGQNIHALLGRRLGMKLVMLLVTPLLTALALLKDGTLASIMSIGMLASLGSCVLICIKGLLDARIWLSWPAKEHLDVHSIWPSNPAALGTVLAVMFSAFSVMGTVPCIRGQMKDPQEFLPAFQSALSIVLAMYLAVMFLGYWGYGNYVQHNVVDSMMFPPQTLKDALSMQRLEEHDMTENPIGIIMAVLVTTYLFLGFSLFFKCIAGMVRNFGGTSRLYKEGHIANQILRTLMVVAVVAAGLAVPHFRDLMAIMSSVCCSCNNVFFPLIFAFKLENPSTVTDHRRILHGCIFLLGIFCFSLGLWSSLSNLYNKMGTDSALHHVPSRNDSSIVTTTIPAAMVGARLVTELVSTSIPAGYFLPTEH